MWRAGFRASASRERRSRGNRPWLPTPTPPAARASRNTRAWTGSNPRPVASACPFPTLGIPRRRPVCARRFLPSTAPKPATAVPSSWRACRICRVRSVSSETGRTCRISPKYPMCRTCLLVRRSFRRGRRSAWTPRRFPPSARRMQPIIRLRVSPAGHRMPVPPTDRTLVRARVGAQTVRNVPNLPNLPIPTNRRALHARARFLTGAGSGERMRPRRVPARLRRAAQPSAVQRRVPVLRTQLRQPAVRAVPRRRPPGRTGLQRILLRRSPTRRRLSQARLRCGHPARAPRRAPMPQVKQGAVRLRASGPRGRRRQGLPPVLPAVWRPVPVRA